MNILKDQRMQTTTTLDEIYTKLLSLSCTGFPLLGEKANPAKIINCTLAVETWRFM